MDCPDAPNPSLFYAIIIQKDTDHEKLPKRIVDVRP